MPETRILFLRHGEVASHKGDVPVTDEGILHAERVGKAVGRDHPGAITVMFGGTRRTRETAEAIVRGIDAPDRVDGPHDSFALRNPDTYAAGTRVNMVSSPESLAEQVPGMTAEQAAANPWWVTFFDSPDRIGWWLEQDDPPGETGVELARRIERFARSVADPGPLQGRLVLCATHSPVLRSLLLRATGTDPGEPAYVTGAELTVDDIGAVTITAHDPLAG